MRNAPARTRFCRLRRQVALLTGGRGAHAGGWDNRGAGTQAARVARLHTLRRG